MGPLMQLALRSTGARLVGGAAAVVALALLLPADPSARLWWSAVVALAAPWLVLGRSARRRAQGWAGASRAVHARRLLAIELALPLLVVALGAVLAAPNLPAAAVLAAWGASLVCLADVLDRGRTGPGAAWVVCLGFGAAVLTAPLWLAPLFGRPELNGLASVAIGGHPVGAALTGAGLPLLTDPVFYRWTLSGVVEALPLPWTHGASAFGLVALLATASAWIAPSFAPRGEAR